MDELLAPVRLPFLKCLHDPEKPGRLSGHVYLTPLAKFVLVVFSGIMNIIALDGYTLNPGDNPWDEVAKLGAFTCFDRTPVEQIVERARDADIILTNKAPISAVAINH